jgi:hypothetical protein
MHIAYVEKEVGEFRDPNTPPILGLNLNLAIDL